MNDATPTLDYRSDAMNYRVQLTTPFPGLDLPNSTENPDWDRENPMRTFRYTDNWKETGLLFQQALAWAALEAAHKIEHTSDSHVDDQYALARFIANMTDVVYGYDQTMNDKEAICTWLADTDAIDDFIYVSQMLNGSSIANDPKLFSHFTFTDLDDLN